MGGGGLAIWSFEKASYYLERVTLAYSTYTNVLSLKSHTYQLFKQYGDALIIGDEGKDDAPLILKIREDIDNIRASIGGEIELLGDDELDELNALSEIEVKTEQLISELNRISQSDNSNPGVVQSNWSELSDILESSIDQDYYTMIRSFLVNEASEVSETYEVAKQEIRFYRTLASIFVTVSLMAALVSMWIVSRNVSHPLDVLLNGVKEFTNGKLNYRFALNGSSEISKISDTFNMMAEQILQRTQLLTSEKSALEDAVADRTYQLEGLLEDLQHANDKRRKMLADVSHELRTPLTVIRGEADIALRGDKKSVEIYQEALVRIKDAASHTARLVDDLLFIARTEAGEIRLKIEPIDLISVFSEAATVFGTDVSFQTDLESAPLHGDAGRLRQAVVVLLDNASHHGGRAITLAISSSSAGYQTVVEDDGQGMMDDDKIHAFERFYRGSNAAERYHEGLGLGLPIAQSIAESHGGKIELSDRPGGGLVATLSLPFDHTLDALI
ncbi:MAG: HAMP domain-containing histidine kinase [Gammaproteobacteria bacterium]|nr:HAMP domain-containing histidine kinase [Gammaproteobacteria bacterium]